MTEPASDLGSLTQKQQTLLTKIDQLRYEPGWWIETRVPIDQPLSESFHVLVEKGLLRISDKGRCGPLALKVDTWIITLTDKGRVYAKLLADS